EKLPNDAVMHEFRGLCLFALGRYGEASATIYPVLAVQPGMDWTSLSSLYSDVDTFTAQLRKLENYRDANPDNPAARFLLSYLYLSMGYRDQARTELERLVKLQPTDKVSASILKVISNTDESGNVVETAPAPEQPATAAANQPASEPAKPGEKETAASNAANAPAADTLVGKFVAKPSAIDTITLELGADGTFKWSVASGSQTPRGFNGKFEYQDGVLALLSDQNGQRLVGRLTKSDDGQFIFKVVDGPEGDTGLNFSKSS
ncbi:MAG: tetratricopeptide repeat protein, partial [Isosphaeraceae bacterium]